MKTMYLTLMGLVILSVSVFGQESPEKAENVKAVKKVIQYSEVIELEDGTTVDGITKIQEIVSSDDLDMGNDLSFFETDTNLKGEEIEAQIIYPIRRPPNDPPEPDLCEDYRLKFVRTTYTSVSYGAWAKYYFKVLKRWNFQPETENLNMSMFSENLTTSATSTFGTIIVAPSYVGFTFNLGGGLVFHNEYRIYTGINLDPNINPPTIDCNDRNDYFELLVTWNSDRRPVFELVEGQYN